MVTRLIVRLGVWAIGAYVWLLCVGALIIARKGSRDMAQQWLDEQTQRIVRLARRV